MDKKPSLPDNIPGLAAALDELYAAFSHVPPEKNIHFCGCERETCDGTEEIATIVNQTDVRAISSNHVGWFLFASPSLLGSAYTIRRLFPRLVEYALLNDARDVFERAMRDGCYDQWDVKERQGVERFLNYLWTELLTDEKQTECGRDTLLNAVVVFNCMGYVSRSISSCLNAWKNAGKTGAKRLIEYVNVSLDWDNKKGTVYADFVSWDQPALAEERTQSLMNLSDEFLDWLRKPQTEEWLLGYYDQLDTDEQRDCWLQAIDKIQCLSAS